MSASQGCTDEMDLVGKFKEALRQRIGEDSYRMWFANGITFQIEASAMSARQATGAVSTGTVSTGAGLIGSDQAITVLVRNQFALDRLQKNFMTQLRGSAMQACGSPAAVTLLLDQQVAKQTEFDLGEVGEGADDQSTDIDANRASSSKPASNNRASNRARSNRRVSSQGTATSDSGRKGRTTSLANLVSSTRPGTKNAAAKTPRANRSETSLDQMTFPEMAEQLVAEERDAESRRDKSSESHQGNRTTDSDPVLKSKRSQLTFASFVVGGSNQLAHAAATMAAKAPGTASPMFLCGPAGSGKTHLLGAVAETFRRRHRMRRVMHLTAEQFTNDFIASVGNSGIAAFRGRYRDVDALLIDDVQFFAGKEGTIRELLYTVETLSMANRPMLFSGLQAPTEIRGLSMELAGRMAAGLVCPVNPIDQMTRKEIIAKLILQHCKVEVSDSLSTTLAEMATGDGRVLTGLVNNINLLSRMYSRMPTLDEIKQHSGQLLRATRPVPTLSVIEAAVCEAFQLPADTLRGGGQTRSVTEPRMLAMYLARQMTPSAYAEIARYFGGKSHSTAISAEKNVKKWLDQGKTMGRGHASVSVQDALDRVENRLRNVS